GPTGRPASSPNGPVARSHPTRSTARPATRRPPASPSVPHAWIGSRGGRVRRARGDRLVGTPLGADEQRAQLARVGIETAPAAPGTTVVVAAGTQPLAVTPGEDEVIDATVPTWRRDLLVEADIIEEIVRVRGYDLVPATLPDTPMPPHRPDALAIRTMLRETLAGAGLPEAVTFALIAPASVERFPARDDGPLDAQ